LVVYGKPTQKMSKTLRNAVDPLLIDDFAVEPYVTGEIDASHATRAAPGTHLVTIDQNGNVPRRPLVTHRYLLPPVVLVPPALPIKFFSSSSRMRSGPRPLVTPGAGEVTPGAKASGPRPHSTRAAR